jgi:hypothetical protein
MGPPRSPTAVVLNAPSQIAEACGHGPQLGALLDPLVPIRRPLARAGANIPRSNITSLQVRPPPDPQTPSYNPQRGPRAPARPARSCTPQLLPGSRWLPPKSPASACAAASSPLPPAPLAPTCLPPIRRSPRVP